MIQRKRNKKTQILTLILSFLLVFNPLLATRLVYAEEAAETPVVEETIDLPAETENIIETGDAGAQSGTETNVNDNTTEVPGEVVAEPCQSADGCPGTTMVDNENEAEVGSDSLADAGTGENEINNAEGNATIDTGDATAVAETESKVNTNTTLLADDEIEGAKETEETEETEGEMSLVMVDNDNVATVSAEATASANTGKNEINNAGGDANINTGDAIAQADSVNLINTNLTGSDFDYLVLDDSNLEGGIDFYQLWQKLWGQNEEGDFQLSEGVNLSIFSVENKNLASLVNQTTAIADTGDNQADNNDGSATIKTGNAFASANAFNLVNTNITGSHFLVAVINIYRNLIGDLIFPSQDYFLPESWQEDQLDGEFTVEQNQPAAGVISVENQNQAEVENTATAVAGSGENQTNGNLGDSEIETGDAFAQSNSLSIVNTNVFNSSFFTLIINNFGTWLGQILNWSGPGAVEGPMPGSQIYQFEKGPADSDGDPIADGLNSESLVSVNNTNEAQVISTASATASTGGNQANSNQGGATIKTGNAVAIANSTSIVNSNFFGGGFFLGFINIFGSWADNLVFAYPNLMIEITDNRDEISPGEVLEYQINYTNQGKAPAEDVTIHQALPLYLNFLSVNSPQPEMDTQSFDWQLGDLAPGESGEITVRMEVDPGIPTEGSPLVTTAQIGGNGVEENDEDNLSSDETKVVFSDEGDEDSDSGLSSGTPSLYASSWNNAGEFVYPGDTVLFEIVIENLGDGSVYEARLFNELFNEIPGVLGNAEVDLGEIKPGEQVIISFGLSLGEEAEIGQYVMFSWVEGKDGGGELVSSNEAASQFEVRPRGIASLFEARAVEEKKLLGTVLGEKCSDDDDLLPYILLFLLSSFYLLEKSKKLRKAET